jgi:type VI secretion system protein ImpB
MSNSTQHKLSRVRPPRVQITYDVEIGNAIEKKELPFIVGIMSDLSGKPEQALPPVKDRKFVEIDRDNFNDVLASAKPRLAFRVPNRLQPDSKDMLNVELKFGHLDDFGPVEVIKQVPALKKLLEARQRLRDLLTKLDGNDDLDALLRQVVESTEDQKALKADLGGDKADDKADDTPAA